MYEDLIEKKISSQDIYIGCLLHLKKDTVKLPNGKIAAREWIQHPGASAVIPVFPDNGIILVRQYRYPVQQVTWEIPAGKIDNHESPYICAQRELREETGYTAARLIPISTIATTVGFSNEKIHIFMAQDLASGQACPDADEFLNVVKMPLLQALKMIKSGEIIDAKTITAIFLLHDKLVNNN